ncbi:MAG TPA: dihydroxyacetone kinase subunit DhaL [Acidimicrobiales bacterium]|nr:dihydroxyacetone kinase subunit DhaL [Acidimicrobiales bacterium]
MGEEAVTVGQLAAWVRRFADLIAEQKAYLTELDGAVGDGDHGINMDRGMRAVAGKLDAATPGTVDELFKLVGLTLVSTVGGASGPLYGTFFLRLGSACGGSAAVPIGDLVNGLHAGAGGLVERGHAELGDKTMLDSLQPAVVALETAVSAGDRLPGALSKAWAAAVRGRDETVPMVARKGRASYLAERSAGHQDPGATSTALLFEAAAFVFAAGN